MTIDNLDPKCVWKNFYALTQIPRPSKKEWRAVDFMENFGRNLGLETIRDEVGNIIIRKPATPGMENRKGVILQGHLDMVPQNNNDVQHDWENDPVETWIDGEWVKAKGTTLGADNGLGCAVAMAVLESNDLVHGPVEALFTIDEETGMTGAKALKGGILKGDILVNLDSETEGELYVGCAGGLDTDAEFSYKSEPVSKDTDQYRIIIKGLRGGHSGMEINEGRANSNKLMARLLLPLLRDFKGELISIEGGNMRNAIPREAEAVVALPKKKAAKALKAINAAVADMEHEYAPIDPGLEVLVEKTKGARRIIPTDVALNVVKALLACPCNVDRMSLVMPGLVETSNNLAIVKSDGKKINVLRRILRLAAQHGVRHPQDHEGDLQGPLRQGARCKGHPRRPRVRYPLDQLSSLGHDLLRTDPDVPSLPRRETADPHRGEVLELHQGSAQEHSREVILVIDRLLLSLQPFPKMRKGLFNY